MKGPRLPESVAHVTKGVTMRKRIILMVAIAAIAALAVVGTAGAAVTVPSIPVASYGDSLLTELADAIAQVLPYAAAVTGFAIGVGMLKRWLGHRKATRV